MAKLQAAGVTHTRWFMLANGSAGIRFAKDGTPTGLDPHVFQDLDTAVAAARRHGVKITFSLLDFGFCKPAAMVGGVQTGGHADCLEDPAKRKALVEKVLVPILSRYGQEPAIETWELINEPEWVTRGFGTALTSLGDMKKAAGSGSWSGVKAAFHQLVAGGVSRDAMRAFVREGAIATHRAATQPVTVGSASIHTLDMVQGLGLDYYQAHWYDYFNKLAPLDKPVAKLGLDAPLVLGEYPAKNSKKSGEDIIRTVQAGGYSGAFAWSFGASDPFSTPDALAAPAAFNKAHPDKAVP